MTTEAPQRMRLAPTRPLNPRVVYPHIGWNPHAGQWEVIDSRARNKVVAAGRRFGKSEIGGHRLVSECLDTRRVKSDLEALQKRREFWVVGPSYTDAEKEFRVLWNRLKALGFDAAFDRPGSYYNAEQGQMHLSMFDGTFQVHAKSEKHPDSLVGEGLSGVILAEAAKLKKTTWTKLIRPTLGDFAGWALFTSTPEGKNWFYDLWRAGQNPLRPDWASWRMPSWRNPHVYPEGASDEAINALRTALAEGAPADGIMFDLLGVDPEIGALLTDLTEESFNQEIAADFTEFVGRVFKAFDEDLHVGDYSRNPGWSLHAAVDYGYTNPNVWLLLQVDPFGEQVQVLDEVYEPGLTADEFARTVQQRGLCPSDVRSFYPDPASPGDTRILENILKVPARGGTGGEIRWRVDAIRAALKERNTHLPAGHANRHPTLVFDRKCERTIADMLNYRYPERKRDIGSNDPENPMKKDDHGPEALGRFYAGHFGTPDKQNRKARVRKSSIAG